MRTLTIVQARMNSTRLPGKALVDINGKPALQRVIERLNNCTQTGHVIVATSIDQKDDPIYEWCGQYGADVFRGSLDDVLDRYHKCATRYAAETIVRVTADCPLLNPELLDDTIRLLHAEHADYAATNGYPAGIGQEAFTNTALKTTWQHATSPYDREHVVTWMLDHLNTTFIDNPSDQWEPNVTLDTQEDLDQIRCLLT